MSISYKSNKFHVIQSYSVHSRLFILSSLDTETRLKCDEIARDFALRDANIQFTILTNRTPVSRWSPLSLIANNNNNNNNNKRKLSKYL